MPLISSQIRIATGDACSNEAIHNPKSYKGTDYWYVVTNEASHDTVSHAAANDVVSNNANDVLSN
jgi:hypothetical protein